MLALPAAIAALALAAPRVLPLLPDPFPIHDEQRTYHVFAGLTNWRPGEIWPASPLMLSGIGHRKNKRRVLLTGGIGFRAYAAGPGTHVIDRYGLSDPLLARIAVIDKKAWMPGHFSRATPPGYLKTHRVGENRIEHPELAELYEKIALITRAPLLSSGRLKAIALLNLGH